MGGYLILNFSGRPLEFHCSLPFRPTRTQYVLYGATLESFLVGEAIGKPLSQKPKVKPSLVVANHHAALDLSETLNVPIISTDLTGNSIDGELIDFDSRSALVKRDWSEPSLEVLQALPSSFDLDEPFDRINEAFAEARGERNAA